MKRIKQIISIAILLAEFVCFCGNARADEGDSLSFDGYLVYTEMNLDGEEESAFPLLEKVAEGIYLTRNAETGRELLQQGTAWRVEPNYSVELWDTGESEEPEDTGDSEEEPPEEPKDTGDFEEEPPEEPEEEDPPVSNGWAYEAVAAGYAAEFGLDGSGIRVAVIDSGVDVDNPDLVHAFIQEGKNYLSDTPKLSGSMYHGTKVAQVLAGDPNLLGGTGLSRGAELVSLRCFSATISTYADTLIRAIRDAVDVYQCDIINMSWGMKKDVAGLHEAIRYAYDRGVILVAAAGNVGTSAPQGTLMYPAAYPEVLGVGSTDQTMAILASSQNTAAVSLYAPGGQLPFCDQNGNLVRDSGTSFASPCVSAMAAVMKQLAPFLGPAEAMELFAARSEAMGVQLNGAVPEAGFSRLDSLLGMKWGAVIRETTEEGGTGLVLRSWMLHRGGGTYVAAVYSPAGQMKSLALLEQEADAGSCHVALEGVEKEDTISLFYLDAEEGVFTDCDRFSAPEDPAEADRGEDETGQGQ